MTSIVQDSVNALQLAHQIEPLAQAAWPARESIMLNGWLLRFSDGHSSRSNSVSTLMFDGVLEASIDEVQTAYRRRNLVPQFQISPASAPDGLEAALVARGYRHKPAAVVMIADAQSIANSPREAKIGATADSDFIRLTLEASHSPEDGRERLDTLARIAFPTAYISVPSQGQSVACGASVVTGLWAGIYVMRTSSSHRRQGNGSHVLRVIAHWALRQGPARLYLQVDETNVAARALYAAAGFRDGYRYFHYRAP